jgi:1-acyl-sn-glycerol-3-phosphate acyltransferase
MLMSFALRRPMNYMARESLFANPVFRYLIESLNAFPVRRGQADTAAIKESMRRLKAGGQVVVFAEGTRTHDGRIGRFLPGVALLCRRAADWTIPVLIDGAYEAWPRNRAFPSPGRVVVQYGQPIPRDAAQRCNGQELVDKIRRELIEIQHQVRIWAGREPFDYACAPPGQE